MKKVLLIASSLSIGGAERIAINTYNSLKENYEVALLVQRRLTVEYPFDGTLIDVQLPAKKTFVGRIFNRIKRIFRVVQARRRIKPDYVISFGASSNVLNVISGIFSKGKNVTAIHGFSEVKKSFSLKFMLSHSDKVICISKAMQNGLLKIYPKAQNSVVIENGYEIDKIIGMSVEREDFDVQNPYVMLMGRLNPVKRTDIAILAFSQIQEKHPNMNLLILGDGDRRKELIALCRDLHIDDRVKFVGRKLNPFVYLNNAKLFVLSSQTEGFPNALIEALACGTPIVSVDCESGPREILSEHFSKEPIKGIKIEKYGVLVEQSKDIEFVANMLAKAMEKVLDDEKILNQYKQNGIERAKQFDQSVYKAKVIDLLDSLG